MLTVQYGRLIVSPGKVSQHQCTADKGGHFKVILLCSKGSNWKMAKTFLRMNLLRTVALGL